MTDLMIGLSRRAFLGTGGVIVLGAAAIGDGIAVEGGEGKGRLPDGFPGQARAMVDEIVLVSHFSYERVKGLLDRAPDLAKAGRDWGFGDWETALGAASHTGNRDIALLLMEHGARADIYTYAMLGNTAVVRGMIEGRPGAPQRWGGRGPHGITLAAHARAGGEGARETLEYLEGVEGADEGVVNVALSEEARGRYMGTYLYDGGEDVRAEVGWSERFERVTIGHAGWSARSMHCLGDHAFSPVGAEGVRIEFAVEGESAATGLRITGPAFVASAVRV